MISTNSRPVKQVKSVGAVIINSEQRLLIMFQKQNRYWEFPKGKVEIGEEQDELTTLKREIFEETGLNDLKIVRGFKYYLRYQFVLKGTLIKKNNIFYLATTNTNNIKLSEEHLAYKWVSLIAVNRYLRHKNQRILVYKLRNFLKNNPLK